MGVIFLQPAAWWAALAVVAPIAIHLLTRATRTPLVFPSIRFLEPTRLSAVSRRAIEDWPLLLLRIAVILLAVAAMAGPVLVTPERDAAWRARVARGIVLEDGTAAPDDERRSATVGKVFARARLRDAVADAVRWLAQQEPSTREIVVLSAFRRGSTTAADFDSVPPGMGVRLVRTANGAAVRERELGRLTWSDGRAVRVTERVLLAPDATAVRAVRADPLDVVPIRVIATPDQQPTADAALRAVLRRGLRLPPAGLLEPVAVGWPGSVDGLAAMLESRLAASLDSWEPETLSDADLAALARSAAPGATTPVDSGDRRMVWALAVGLLVAELWLRQGARPT